MEVFDKDGNPVENIFSQEELDAKIAEAVKEATLAPVADPKPESASEAQKPEDIMAAIKALSDTVSGFVKSNESAGASKYSSELDEEKKIIFNNKFEALQKTGLYENTLEGIEKRSADAYQLTTGEAFDAGNFNMQNLSSAGGRGPIKTDAQVSEADKEISAILGNTEEDIKKYGGNQTA